MRLVSAGVGLMNLFIICNKKWSIDIILLNLLGKLDLGFY